MRRQWKEFVRYGIDGPDTKKESRVHIETINLYEPYRVRVQQPKKPESPLLDMFKDPFGVEGRNDSTNKTKETDFFGDISQLDEIDKNAEKETKVQVEAEKAQEIRKWYFKDEEDKLDQIAERFPNPDKSIRRDNHKPDSAESNNKDSIENLKKKIKEELVEDTEDELYEGKTSVFQTLTIMSIFRLQTLLVNLHSLFA